VSDEYIQAMLERGVPRIPLSPPFEELARRATTLHRRNKVKGVVAGGLVGLVLGAAVGFLPSELRAVFPSEVAAENRAETEGSNVPSSVSCRGRKSVAATEFASPIFPSPDESLAHDLARRHISLKASAFDRRYLSPSEVRYWFRDGDHVLAVGTAVREATGWALPVLVTCAELSE
jgi:hypothetical protein